MARIGTFMAAHNLRLCPVYFMDVPSIENFMAQVGRSFRLPEQGWQPVRLMDWPVVLIASISG